LPKRLLARLRAIWKFVQLWLQHVFIGTGKVREPLEDVQRLKELLVKAGLGKDRLRIVIQKGAAHSERWWVERLPVALQFLFPPLTSPLSSGSQNRESARPKNF
jgi:hypothetical protein